MLKSCIVGALKFIVSGKAKELMFELVKSSSKTAVKEVAKGEIKHEILEPAVEKIKDALPACAQRLEENLGALREDSAPHHFDYSI